MAVFYVGLADLKISSAPDIITTIGLGSCIGITLFDPVRKLGGMIHIMLPTCTEANSAHRAKYADTGITDLVERMRAMGCNPRALKAKIAGGASMFPALQKRDIHMIGQRNAEMSRQMLYKFGIPLIAEETGGTYGRTIELNTATGALQIKTVGRGVKTI